MPSNLTVSEDPVVVTGVGMVTPLGSSREETWRRLLAGESGTRRLKTTSEAVLWNSLRVDPGDDLGCPPAGVPKRHGDRVVDLAIYATQEALSDAGFSSVDDQRRLWGVVVGTSKGSLTATTELWLASSRFQTAEAQTLKAVLAGPAVVAQELSRWLGTEGPLLSPVAACATGLACVQSAVALLRQKTCDVVIAGSADDSLHPLVMASFSRLGVLARHADPSKASRPFDQDRRGFVIGAGAASLILERRSSAMQRGAPWYAEVAGGTLTSDPTGMTSLDASGEELAAMLRRFLDRQDLNGRVPDVINLHGTGTRLNDPAECRALQSVFGAKIGRASCGSFKGALGHLLGAAGSVELGLCCLMLRDQKVPPNVNLDRVDSDCQLPWVRGQSQTREIASVLKLSLGFGGHQGAMWLNRGIRHSTPI